MAKATICHPLVSYHFRIRFSGLRAECHRRIKKWVLLCNQQNLNVELDGSRRLALKTSLTIRPAWRESALTWYAKSPRSIHGSIVSTTTCYSAVRCSVVRCSAVQYSAVHYSAAYQYNVTAKCSASQGRRTRRGRAAVSITA